MSMAIKQEGYTKEHARLIEEILPLSVSRQIFTVFPILRWFDKRVTYEQLLDDLGTWYSLGGDEFPNYDVDKAELEVTVPSIKAGHVTPAGLLAERRASNKNTTPAEAVRRQALKFANDEDMYAIAGETTFNSVNGLSDTTNTVEAASTELDLTSFSTLKTTLNGLINQLNSNMNASSGNQTVKQFPLILLVTSDVEERFWELNSSLEDSVFGYNMATSILQGRGGPGSRIAVSNSLGATVTKSGNRFTQSTDGTTNALLFPSSPQFQGIFASPFRRIEREDKFSGLQIKDEERWRFLTFRQDHHIYSGTVDITS